MSIELLLVPRVPGIVGVAVSELLASDTIDGCAGVAQGSGEYDSSRAHFEFAQQVTDAEHHAARVVTGDPDLRVVRAGMPDRVGLGLIGNRKAAGKFAV